ncbi:MAG: YARHG domain-containing protein [Ignavibacteria bacterium]
MKKISVLILLCLLASCGKKQDTGNSTGDSKSTTSGNNTSDTKTNSDESKKDSKVTDSPVIGSYTGGFQASVYDKTKEYVYENRITIFIDTVAGDVLSGHSVVAGNNRPFKGIIKLDGKIYNAEASEPGDDKYDGKFSFKVDPASGTLEGTWKANDKKLDVTERTYTLSKKQFKYDAAANLPEDVQWAELYEKNPKFPDKFESVTPDVTKINASAKELTKKDIENLYKGDLEIIRNAIYARHGYSFKTRRIRFIFDQYVPWYMPVTTDARGDLTEIEKKNIELMKRYEEHAEKYYDEYGR